jgi:tol-pal system protein YbgF
MPRPLPLAFVIAMLAGGCATKRDLQTLQMEIGEMQDSQERLLRAIQQQNAAIVDSLHAQDIRLRGDLTNQMVQLERQLVQIQELTGQGQQRLAELRQDLQAREAALERAAAAANAMPAGDAEELFSSAEAAVQRGSLATAKAGFAEFITTFPQHERTPEARLYLAKIITEEGNPEEALKEYAKILELHPNSPEAATALYQEALLERDRGNTARARSMLNQLTAAYPGSPEAAAARDELRRLR